MNVFDINVLAGTIAAAKDKAIQKAGEYGLNDALRGHVLPPLPPFPVTPGSPVGQPEEFELEQLAKETGDSPSFTIFGTAMCFPLSIKLKSQLESDWWLLPTEPIISLGGGNELIRRNVSKVSTGSGQKRLRGSIKERWAQDDYTISIDGLFTKFDDWTYPQDDVQKLRGMLEAREAIDVKCQLLEIFGIGRMVVEKYDFPFTKGEENQAYRITAYSDDDWDLFIKLS